MKKYHHVHHLTKQISTENFDLILVYKVSQSALSMDIFYGLRDRYDALVGAFRREDKKEIDRLETEYLKDIEVKLKGMDQSAIDEKLKIIRREELAEGLIPRDFEETLSLQSGVGSVIAKR